MNSYLYNGHTRLDFFCDSPTPTGTLLLYTTLVAWQVFFVARDRKRPALAAVLFGCFLAVCYLLFTTYSRGAILALGTGLAVYAWMTRGRRILLLGLALGAVTLLVPSAGDRVASATHVENDRSISNRLHLWAESVPLLKAHAVAGVGAGNFGSEYATWYQDVSRIETYATAVNTPLTMFCLWGIPRGAAIVALLSTVTVLAFVAARRWHLPPIFPALIAGFYVDAFFSTHQYAMVLVLDAVVFLAPAVFLLVDRRNRRPISENRRRLAGASSLFVAVQLAVLTLLIGIFPDRVNAKPIFEDSHVLVLRLARRGESQAIEQPAVDVVFASLREKETAARIARSRVGAGDSAVLVLAKDASGAIPSETIGSAAVLLPSPTACRSVTILPSAAWTALSFLDARGSDPLSRTRLILVGCPSSVALTTRIAALKSAAGTLFLESEEAAASASRLESICVTLLVDANYSAQFTPTRKIARLLAAGG